MPIDESQTWWYWPQVFWEQDVYFRDAFNAYPSEYEDIWNTFDKIKQDGENVTREEINEQLDDLEVYTNRVPEGYLRWDDPVMIELDVLNTSAFYPADGPEPSGFEQLSARMLGYIQWQAYRLEIAMQASKLVQFGRRGRRKS